MATKLIGFEYAPESQFDAVVDAANTLFGDQTYHTWTEDEGEGVATLSLGANPFSVQSMHSWGRVNIITPAITVSGPVTQAAMLYSIILDSKWMSPLGAIQRLTNRPLSRAVQSPALAEYLVAEIKMKRTLFPIIVATRNKLWGMGWYYILVPDALTSEEFEYTYASKLLGTLVDFSGWTYSVGTSREDLEDAYLAYAATWTGEEPYSMSSKIWDLNDEETHPEGSE